MIRLENNEKCPKCEVKLIWDRTPDPMWRTGIYELKCPKCGYITHVNIGGIDTVYMSRYTTTTKRRDVDVKNE
jgi:phage FluMu protein Com